MSKEQLDELLAKAKDVLITGTPKATKDNTKAVEATDPILANELLAERADLASQIKELTARKTEIDNIIKDAIGNNDELTIHNATVASISRWRETEVQKDVVMELFPIKDYPEIYKRVSRSRLNIK